MQVEFRFVEEDDAVGRLPQEEVERDVDYLTLT